jgi:DNA-binding XRE family transcriptional regulator
MAGPGSLRVRRLHKKHLHACSGIFTRSPDTFLMEKEKQAYLRKLGRHIQKTRESRGYSQDRVYLEGDIPRSTIFRIEGGHIEPKAFTLKRIADTIGVPVKKFFDFE